jgi:hypothetical protein
MTTTAPSPSSTSAPEPSASAGPSCAVSPGSRVFSFACSVAGTDWGEEIVNARTRGRAKREYHLSVIDAWPDVPFTAVRARKIGAPHTTADFIRNAQYRGLPNVRCGQRVKVGDARGVIVGHNSSANFDVLFDDDSPRYAGQTLNCHPNEVTLDHENMLLGPTAAHETKS